MKLRGAGGGYVGGRLAGFEDQHLAPTAPSTAVSTEKRPKNGGEKGRLAGAAQRGLTLDFIDHGDPVAGVPVASFQPGELVSFEYRGCSVLGEVLRVNRKTVNVKPVKPRMAADYFRISPQFLTLHTEPPIQ